MNRILAALVLLSFALTASAQQKPEDMIKARKAGLSFMSFNMGRVKANIDGTFNKDQVVAAANVVAATANSQLWTLFAAGTDKDIGDQKTRAKPELFQQPDKVGQLINNLAKEANELQKVAMSGDAAAVKAQFGKVGAACKACHDDFRKD
jgi:cytochrome c556